MSNNSIRSIDWTLSGATTPGQSRPGSNGNERVLHIPQSFRIRALPSDALVSYPRHLSLDALVSYPGHSLVGSYPSAEMQSVYSTAPANWVERF